MKATDLIVAAVPLIGLLFLITLVNRRFSSGISVRSKVDGQSYFVINNSNKQEAADTLARLNANIGILLKDLQAKLDTPNDLPDDMTEPVRRILKRYDPASLSENVYRQEEFTSYTFNKGQSIALCLTDRNPDKTHHHIEPMNKLMFVILHELSHIGDDTVSEGARHTPKFWHIFSWIYNEAIRLGIHRYENYNASPVKYCGIEIQSTPQ